MLVKGLSSSIRGRRASANILLFVPGLKRYFAMYTALRLMKMDVLFFSLRKRTLTRPVQVGRSFSASPILRIFKEKMKVKNDNILGETDLAHVREQMKQFVRTTEVSKKAKRK